MPVKRSLIIVCADPRCWERAQDLFRHYASVDGHAPYLVRVGGASMLYADVATREAQLASIKVFLNVVDHVHLEDHDGGETGPGCAAYSHAHASGAALHRTIERELHLANLAKAVEGIHAIVAESGRTISVSTQIDHLKGDIELISG